MPETTARCKICGTSGDAIRLRSRGTHPTLRMSLTENFDFHFCAAVLLIDLDGQRSLSCSTMSSRFSGLICVQVERNTLGMNAFDGLCNRHANCICALFL